MGDIGTEVDCFVAFRIKSSFKIIPFSPRFLDTFAPDSLHYSLVKIQFLKQSSLFVLAAALCFSPARAAVETQAETQSAPLAVAPEIAIDKIEVARVRLENIQNGEISGSRDAGKTWTVIGHIAVPTIKVNPRGYNASKYGPPGTVVATAVNAIHLKAGQNTRENRGIIWSLAPKAEDDAGRQSLQSEVSPGSSAYTDMPGGSGIFGGIYTPFVGSPIFLDNDKNNELKPLPDNYVPRLSDVWTIKIERPRRYPRAIVFENRFAGLITIEYRDEKPRIIGQVLRPVQGVGRFIGSYFAETGRLRANHNGVIDISTSPRGKIGSFQIVPANHAMSPELSYVLLGAQWMVIGPAVAGDPSWEGIAPLYSDFLRPRYDKADWENPDTMEAILGRFYFEIKRQGKADWEPMPEFSMAVGAPLPKWANSALSKVTHLRIAFPFTWTEPETLPAVVPNSVDSPKLAPVRNGISPTRIFGLPD